MKRGWMALALAAILVIAAASEYLCVTSRAQVYIEMLDEADELMQNRDIVEAQSVMERLDHRIGEEERTFNIFLNHHHMEEICENVSMLRRYAQTGTQDDFLALASKTRRELLHIIEGEAPIPENLL